MHIYIKSFKVLTIVSCLTLLSYGGSYDRESKDSDRKENKKIHTTTVILPTMYTEDVGRLLGSQCAQCHGTNGVSVNRWDSIAGEDDIYAEIFDHVDPIMIAQAHGYTETEIMLIEDWLKTLKSTKTKK